MSKDFPELKVECLRDITHNKSNKILKLFEKKHGFVPVWDSELSEYQSHDDKDSDKVGELVDAVEQEYVETPNLVQIDNVRERAKNLAKSLRCCELELSCEAVDSGKLCDTPIICCCQNCNVYRELKRVAEDREFSASEVQNTEYNRTLDGEGAIPSTPINKRGD